MSLHVYNAMHYIHTCKTYFLKQELKDQLQQERQQHEHELTALQSLHTQQLEIMSARHKQETDHLKLKYQNETNGKILCRFTFCFFLT